MASETRAAARQSPSAFLIILIVVCLLLVVINVSTALHQSSLNSAVSGQDIYTLETETP